MLIINRLIPVLSPVLIFIGLQYLIIKPHQLFWLSPLILLIFLAGLWQLTGRNLKIEKFWRYLITPFFFLFFGIIFLIFLDSQPLKQLVIIILAALLAIYLEVIFLWFHLRLKYQLHSLENITAHLNLLTIFLATTSFISLIIFLGLSFWYFLAAFIILNFLLNYELIWSSGTTWRESWHYLALTTLILTEIFWAVNFLPSSVYVQSIIVTIAYYLLSGIIRNWLNNIREGKVIKRYLIISLICLVIILASAK